MQVLADGRVRRSRDEWQKIIERHRNRSLPIAAFCEKEEISRNAFASKPWPCSIMKVSTASRQTQGAPSP